MKLLQIDSSARTSSVTRRLTAKFATHWRENHPDGEVIQRDLSATALPQITDDWGATQLEESKITPAQRSYLSTSDELIEELEAADTIVIGAPMYNFSMPSTLKAWVDYVHVLGATSPPEEGIAPLQGKRVAVVSSRATPTGADPPADFVLGPLFTVLGGFMSMDVQAFVVHTEPPAAAGDFHRPIDVVRREFLECAESWQ